MKHAIIFLTLAIFFIFAGCSSVIEPIEEDDSEISMVEVYAHPNDSWVMVVILHSKTVITQGDFGKTIVEVDSKYPITVLVGTADGESVFIRIQMDGVDEFIGRISGSAQFVIN